MNPKDGLKYVWIPPGTFTMGCSAGDTECDDDENPAHEVTLTKGFWMGQTEVTQDAYRRVTGKNPSDLKGARLPVENLRWTDAYGYCQAVGMRLPTEAEWEYGARGAPGSTPSRYGTLDLIAWYDEASSGGSTHEPRQKQANAWGLYDMLGNVWEWVADRYAYRYPSGSAVDPQGPANGRDRVVRGGSSDGNAGFARASNRVRISPDTPYAGGVRCAGN
ncbi:MAG: formylglycine-generating enzyme family protein [Terriglobia bacterium]